MSCILSISSHYSPLCCWKRAVSVAFCSSSSFRVSHLLCSALLWSGQATSIYAGSCNLRGKFDMELDHYLFCSCWILKKKQKLLSSALCCLPVICVKSVSAQAYVSLICLHIFQLSSVASQTSGRLKKICLHWLVFVRLNSGQTKPGYWHRTGKRPRHKHCICSPTLEAAHHWPSFTFLRKCVSVFVHSNLNSTQM